MILIADSGATKIDWRIIDDEGKIKQTRTPGFSPYLTDPKSLIKDVEKSVVPEIPKGATVSEVFFYGTGCIGDNVSRVRNILAIPLPEAKISVNNDVLAAARALCGHEAGIACILGTGSNSCLYDGEKIIRNIPGLGFALGDEGSGAYLGKTLLADLLRGSCPAKITERLQKRFDLSMEEVLRRVYRAESPSQYLAGFARFIQQNIKEPYLYQLVYKAFNKFIEKSILQYEDHAQLKVHFTGSVAFYFGNILRQVANDKGIVVQHILENPIAGLTLFHQPKASS